MRLAELVEDFGLYSAPPALWASGASPAELATAARLQASAAARIVDANDPERLATALGWVERFRASQPNRIMFVLPQGSPEEIGSAQAVNARTLADLAEFIREHGSVRVGQRGRTVTADTISGYVSTLREALGLSANHPITSSAHGARPRRQIKHMRLDDGPSAGRKRRLGIQAPHLRVLAASPAFERQSDRGFRRWVAVNTAKSALLRAGEVGMPRRAGAARFDHTRGITLAPFDAATGVGSFVWLSPATVEAACPELRGRWGVILMVTAIKDQGTTRARRMPVPIAALHPGGVSDDPLCVFSLLWLLYQRRVVEAEDQPLHLVPLFAFADGSVMTSGDVDDFASEAFEALGEPPEDTGGAALRIGGASDIRQSQGLEAGRALITERGRWGSDIGWIYQRGDVGGQLKLSVDMAAAAGAATEALIPGWSQPAIRGP